MRNKGCYVIKLSLAYTCKISTSFKDWLEIQFRKLLLLHNIPRFSFNNPLRILLSHTRVR